MDPAFFCPFLVTQPKKCLQVWLSGRTVDYGSSPVIQKTGNGKEVTSMDSEAYKCGKMASLASSPYLLTVLFVHTIFSLVSLPLLLLSIRYIHRMNLIHHSTRHIVILNLLALMVHSVTRIAMHGTDLVNYLTPHISACEILPSYTRCHIMRVPFNISMYLACLSTITIALERLVSTFTSKDYENNRSVGYMLLAFQAMLTFFLFGMLFPRTRDPTRILYYCQTTAKNNTSLTIISISSLIVLQILAVIILKYLKLVNQKQSMKQKMNPELRQRYNVNENLRTITIVMPFCCTSCVFTSIFLAIVIILLFFSRLIPMDIYYALTDGSLLLPPYAVLLPFILRRMSRYVTQESQNSFHNHLSQTNSRRAGQFYFDSLAWAWKK
ncbi:hypothetical protein Y032_0128g1450 [Ancylostoma ceylanicum]|nr:hypothetical protein Y032_0128g1450 [Ancylostoma ceylanicum]